MKFNRLNDLYFKRLLGDKRRKNFTLNFLNAMLDRDENNYFTDITFLDKDNEPDTIDGKLSKLDIRADMNDGTQIEIEVQVLPFKLMAERSLFYWSKMYAEQLNKSERYKKLKRTVAINLLNFDYLIEEKEWHNVYALLNIKSHRKLTDHMEIHFAEIPKFKLKDIRKMRASETWMAYFSGNYDDKELEELSMNKPIMKEVMDFERSFLMDKMQRREYEQREKALRDYYSYMDETFEDGYDKGFGKGKMEGKMEGRIEGKMEGRIEGRKEGKIEGINEIALRMLKRGKELAEIVEDTGLSIEEVKKLQA
ncbi:Rpn family recombination-promoting nuclease/putative transposase [Megamonas hypermegale]|uniref:Rpn family recombination-promoting nuclease/putative transposase n=2 Tax=Megamonas hypermegale TaxID=158847 RepID=UPI0026EF1374|nr:Rpn family recombination-promoting nuclease/putative transposase [Megamonas hypermegale]